jgi:hypothetical protein
MMKKNHPFKLTLLSLAILASFSAYAHGEYTDVNTEASTINDKDKTKNKKTKKLKANKVFGAINPMKKCHNSR